MSQVQIEDLLKTFVWDKFVKLAISKLFSAVPFLAWGPVGVVVGWLITKFADALYVELKDWFNMEQILLTNLKLKKKWDDASVRLAIVALGEGDDSEAYQKALKENDEAFSRLISYRAAS